MGWRKKKPDLISDRARSLNTAIARLEAEIKELDSQLEQQASQRADPKFRSTALPSGGTIQRSPEKPAAKSAPPPGPVFEEMSGSPLKPRAETEAPEMFNDLGVRKYDLPALLSRIRNHFRGPTTSNPRLVNYLAAGGVHGLRPLRYEKRMARRGFILLVVVVTLILLGLAYALLPRR